MFDNVYKRARTLGRLEYKRVQVKKLEKFCKKMQQEKPTPPVKETDKNKKQQLEQDELVLFILYSI